MQILASIDHRIICFGKRYYSRIARFALFSIYFYFGFLKIIGASPASQLALGFADRMGVGTYGQQLFIILAIIECLIGVLILFPKLTRIVLLVMFCHMLLVSAPLILYPEAVWKLPFVPNLEGQYIIKNAAIVALALGLTGSIAPIPKK